MPSSCIIGSEWKRMETNEKPTTENKFRDALVQEIIGHYTTQPISQPSITNQSTEQQSFQIQHGSQLQKKRGKCVRCLINGRTSHTQRFCPDCPSKPSLCQTLDRDCHTEWHSPKYATIHTKWIKKKTVQSTDTITASDKGTKGRPKGSRNKSKRRGNYKNY